MTELEKIYERFVNYEWNEVSDSLKESILKAINEALKQGQNLPLNSVVGQSEQLPNNCQDYFSSTVGCVMKGQCKKCSK